MVDQVALRIEMLEDALELIESQADGHKRSVAYNGGENIALVNVATSPASPWLKAAQRVQQQKRAMG
jgi:hypothetical protein